LAASPTSVRHVLKRPELGGGGGGGDPTPARLDAVWVVILRRGSTAKGWSNHQATLGGAGWSVNVLVVRSPPPNPRTVRTDLGF